VTTLPRHSDAGSAPGRLIPADRLSRVSLVYPAGYTCLRGRAGPGGAGQLPPAPGPEEVTASDVAGETAPARAVGTCALMPSTPQGAQAQPAATRRSPSSDTGAAWPRVPSAPVYPPVYNDLGRCQPQRKSTCAIASPATPAIRPLTGAAACTSNRCLRECLSRSGAAATTPTIARPGACSRGCDGASIPRQKS